MTTWRWSAEARTLSAARRAPMAAWAGESRGREVRGPPARGAARPGYAPHGRPRTRGAVLDAGRRVGCPRARPVRRLGGARHRGAVPWRGLGGVRGERRTRRRGGAPQPRLTRTAGGGQTAGRAALPGRRRGKLRPRAGRPAI